MNIRRSITFIFEDRKCIGKLLRGGAYNLLFFTGFFTFVVAGYLTRLMCDLLEGRDASLPEWRPLPELFSEGLQPVLILLVYTSPAILTAIVSLYIALPYAGTLQMSFLTLASLLLPVALIHFVTTRSLKRALHLPTKVSFIVVNAASFIRAWLVSVILTLAALVICCLVCVAAAIPASIGLGEHTGIVTGLTVGAVVACFVAFPLHVIATHLYAQAYRKSKPFGDDAEGEMRASIVVPPSLKGRQ